MIIHKRVQFANAKSLFHFLLTGESNPEYVSNAQIERKKIRAFFNKLTRRKFLFLPAYTNSSIMTLGIYINELLFDQNCVVIPGLGGFITRRVPSQIHHVSNKITPPGKKIAFNQGLHLNDGILANYIAHREGISYEQSLEKIQGMLVELKQTLFENRTVHLEKVGTFYMDFDEVMTFHPDAELNVSKEDYGLVTISASPIVRSADEKVKHKIRSRVDQRQRKLKRSRAIIKPIMQTVAAACLVFAVCASALLAVPESSQLHIAGFSLEAIFGTPQPIHIPVKSGYIIDKETKTEINELTQISATDTTWALLLQGFNSFDETYKAVESLRAEKIPAYVSLRREGKIWLALTQSGDKQRLIHLSEKLKPRFPQNWVYAKPSR